MSQKAQIKINTLGLVLVLSSAMLFFFYDVILQISPSVMVKPLMQAFNVSALGFGNLAACYFYIYTIMQLPAGVLYDRFGVRKLMIIMLLICALGALIFSLAHTIYIAMVGRLLMGFGSAFAFVGVLKVATIYLPQRFIAMLVGLTLALGMVGAIVGNILLVMLVDIWGWRAVMYILTVTGFVILAGMIVCLLHYPIPKKMAHIRHKTMRPVLIHLLSTVRLSPIWINAIIAFLIYLPVSVFAELWAIAYLTQGQHFSRFSAAMINSCLFFGLAVCSPIVGYFSDRFQNRKLFLMGGLILGLVALSLVVFIPNQSKGFAAFLFFIIGVAAAIESLSFCVSSELSPPSISATAFAFTNLIVNVGVSVFQPVIGGILDVNWKGARSVVGVPIFSYHAFEIALSVLPAAFLLALILLYWLPETHARPYLKPQKRKKCS